MYAVIELCTMLLLFQNGDDMTNNQYLFIDGAITLVLCVVISRTGPDLKIAKSTPNKSIINFKFIISSIGQLMIQIGTQLGFYYVLTKYFIQNNDGLAGSDLTLYNSYMFLICVFQTIVCIYTFNFYAKHKKHCYSNKTFMALVCWIIFFAISFMSIDYFNNTVTSWSLVYLMPTDGEDGSAASQMSRLITIGFSIVNTLLTFGYETLINKIFS